MLSCEAGISKKDQFIEAVRGVHSPATAMCQVQTKSLLPFSVNAVEFLAKTEFYILNVAQHILRLKAGDQVFFQPVIQSLSG